MYYVLPTKTIQGSGKGVLEFCGLNPRVIYLQRASKNSFLKLNYLKRYFKVYDHNYYDDRFLIKI